MNYTLIFINPSDHKEVFLQIRVMNRLLLSVMFMENSIPTEQPYTDDHWTPDDKNKSHFKAESKCQSQPIAEPVRMQNLFSSHHKPEV